MRVFPSCAARIAGLALIILGLAACGSGDAASSSDAPHEAHASGSASSGATGSGGGPASAGAGAASEGGGSGEGGSGAVTSSSGSSGGQGGAGTGGAPTGAGGQGGFASGGAGQGGFGGGSGGAAGGGEGGCTLDADCDDGVFCNGSEICDAGACAPGEPPSCDDGVACTDDFCDLGTDACSHGKNDAKCNDGAFCNGVEVCDPAAGDPQTGCAAGMPVVCNDGVDCTLDACDEASDSCVQTPDDAKCDDGAFCNGVEMCVAGVGCVSGVPIACDDGFACTKDTCSDAQGKCVSIPDDAACSDGLACNGAETCDPAQGAKPSGCVAGAPIACPSDGISCTVDACSEATGACEHEPQNVLCQPGQFCVPGAGGCIAAKPCSKDAECDDGNACNGKETCNLVCKPGAPPSCDDGVACTIDACDPATGACTHTPSDAVCDDGFACNGKETCDADKGCTKGLAPSCDDGIACTFDTCEEPAGTCTHFAQDFLCDDGKVCNGTEKCGANGCEAGAPYTCPDDGIPCTKESCDPAINGCKSIPDNSLCPCGQVCSAEKGGCGKFCNVQTCGGKVYQCGDCIDNDGDCKLDDDDSQCLGPCDNTENLGPVQGSGCYYSPPPGIFSPKLDCAWNGSSIGLYPTSTSVVATPTVANLTDDNGDGVVDTNDIPDVAFISYPYGSTNSNVVLRVVSGACAPLGTMSEHFTVGANEIKAQIGVGFWLDFSSAPAIGDIDADGVPDIVVMKQGGGTLALDNQGKVKWYQASHPTGADYNAAITPAIADLDADGTPEVIAGRVVLNGKTGALTWKGSAGLGINGFLGPVSTIADPDLDGKLNVLAGNTMYSETGAVKWTYSYPVASSSSNCGSGTKCDGFTATGNFDADEYGEIAIVRAGSLYILNHDGKPLVVNGANVKIDIPKAGCALNEGGPPTIADFDGDGQAEIGVAGANYYIVADLECLATPKPAHCSDKGIRWKVSNNDCSSRVTGSSVFDFDGDGQAEVIYNDEKLFRVFRGTDGLLLISVPNVSQTRLEMPVVADVDNDGNAEIVFIENSNSKHGIRIWGDANDSWVATRRIWNQHSYHVTNVTEKGTIPKNEPVNWLEPSPSTVSGKMNNFRQNLPDYDVLSAPDLYVQLSFSQASCPAALTAMAKVCNKGLLQVGPGVPVTFYDDKTKAELPCQGGPAVTKGTIAPNQCETVECALKFPGSLTIKACVDNGSYECASGGNNECEEENNSAAATDGCPGQ